MDTEAQSVMSKPVCTLSLTQVQFLFKYCSVVGRRWGMCLSLTCYMSEMSKWFDVHFKMSKIRKGKILKLNLESKSDVFNVWA